MAEAPRPAPRPAPKVLPPVPVAFPTQSTPATSGRPTIKLKVGAHSKDAESAPDSSAKSAPKPRPRKPKTVDIPDAPPPPYVDDGSHDLLQEVLAIEREKVEEKLHRQRSTSENQRDRVPDAPPPAKRKKIDSSPEEDDILALATPAKRERPATVDRPSNGAGPSTTREKMKMTIPAPTPAPLVSKASSGPSKNKKEKERARDSRPSVEPPRISIKGKEKEVAPTAGPSRPKKVTHATPINEKKCRDLLKTLGKIPEAIIFARPVDPVADGCPT